MATTATLDIVLSARDTASAAIKGVGKAADELGARFEAAEKSSKILLGSVSALAIGVGTTSFKAFIDAEKQLARVDAILRTSTGSFEENRKAVLAAASAAVKLGFDDEEAAESIARMFQRTGSLTEATKLNALAMDLARAKNIELSQASTLVGQVLSGNARVLKQFGIELDETKTPMEALVELQGKVAGQAEAFAGTTSGAIATFRQQVQNLQEELGALIASAVTPLIKRANELIASLGGLDGILQRIRAFISENKELIIVLAGAFTGALLPALVSIAAGFVAFVAPLLPFLAIGAGIALLLAELTDNFTNLDAVIDPVKNSLQAVRDFFAEGTIAGDTLRGIIAGLKSAFGEMMTALQPLIEEMKPWLPILAELGKIIAAVVVVGLITLLGVITGLVAAAIPLITNLLKAFREFFEFVANGIAGIILIFQGDLPAATAAFQEGFQSFLDFWKAAFDTLIETVKKFFDVTIGFFTDLFTKLIGASIIPDIINGIVDWFGKLPSLVGGVLVGFISGVLQTFGQFKADLTSKVGEIANAVVQGFQNMVQQAQQLAQQALQAAASAAQAAGGAVRGAATQIGRAVGLQEGGIVTRPTLAMIAEGGSPEAVIPLNRAGGFGGLTLNFNGNVFADDPERFANDIGDAVIRRLNLQVRL